MIKRDIFTERQFTVGVDFKSVIVNTVMERSN